MGLVVSVAGLGARWSRGAGRGQERNQGLILPRSEAVLGAPSSPRLQTGDFSVPTSLFQENLI